MLNERHGAGAFVAVASDVGVQASQRCAAYVAGKHAVVGLVRSLALDFGPRGIRSNVVCPSFVETAMAEEALAGVPEHAVAARRTEVPLERFAQARQVAGAIRFLVGPDASFINGVTLLCDGGATAGYFHPTDTLRALRPNPGPAVP